VQRLSEPRTRGVFWSGDLRVVPAVVLDEEMAVAGLCEGELAQPALETRAPVPEFVCGADRDSADDSDGEHQPEFVDGRHVYPTAACPNPAREDQREVLARQVEKVDPPIEAVVLEPRQCAVG